MSAAAADLHAAYAQAGALQAQRVAAGTPVVGRKIGFTNARLWPVYGVHQPIWGAVYANTLQHLSGPGTYALGHLHSPRLEPEIALRIGRTPAPQATLAELAACVDAVAHGFEVVDCPYPDWRFTAAQAVAVGSLHAALLLGPVMATRAFGANLADALTQVQLRLLCNGSVRDEGSGQAVLGGPLQALQHLVHLLHEQGAPPLSAGEWVTTGSLTQALPIQAGERWHTEISGPPAGVWAASALDVRFAA